ncbi:hypothetical protein ACFSQ7_36425 [Paenibacillus rhizoplanae]
MYGAVSCTFCRISLLKSYRLKYIVALFAQNFGAESKLALALLHFVQDFSIGGFYWAVLLHFLQDFCKKMLLAVGRGSILYRSSPNVFGFPHTSGLCTSMVVNRIRFFHIHLFYRKISRSPQSQGTAVYTTPQPP